MDRTAIERFLDVARGHSVVVDVREVSGAPGNVRTVTIHQGNSVTIEYDRARAYVEGDSEGSGPKYVADYSGLDVLIADLEDYLGAKVELWSNFTESPFIPEVLDDPDPGKTLEYFQDMVRAQRVPLPRGGNYRLAGIYWRHISKYGEYREDKLIEEQEEELGRDDE